MNNLDSVGVCREDEGYDYDFTRGDSYDDDYAVHAPSDYQYARREAREARVKRERKELMELWREEQKARRKERMPLPPSVRRWARTIEKKQEEE